MEIFKRIEFVEPFMKRGVIGLIAIILVFCLSSCSPLLQEIKETRAMMGTYITITVYHEDYNLAKQAISDAFSEMERIEGILSLYSNSSEISVLNEDKSIENASDDLIINIEKATYYGNATNGSFDITVQPILDLYKESFEERQQPPTEEEIAKELEKVDYHKIIVNNNEIRLGPQQKITLGGLTKGYAVDRAIGVLKSEGIEHALINAGGDLRALGKKPNQDNWTIALANPRDKNDYIILIRLNDKAIVTSGDYERYFDENKEFHHIVDPRTGHSSTELISVTIISNEAFNADAISTSVFVMGEKPGLEFIENLEDTEGLLITSDKRIIKSSGFDEVI